MYVFVCTYVGTYVHRFLKSCCVFCNVIQLIILRVMHVIRSATQYMWALHWLVLHAPWLPRPLAIFCDCYSFVSGGHTCNGLSAAAALEGSAVGGREGGGEGCSLRAGSAVPVHEEPSLQGNLLFQHCSQWGCQRWQAGRSQEVGDTHVYEQTVLSVSEGCVCVYYL